MCNLIRKITTIGLMVAALASGQYAIAEGVLKGRVSSKETGASLEGATVELVDLGRKTATLPDGSFVFTGVPNGSYTMTVDYIGLDDVRVGVRVDDGTVFKDIELRPEVDEEIVVTATRLSGQLRAINQQRNAKGIKTIISQELFGQVDDGNIANAMQKLPGLSVDTDGFSEIPRYVNIRGVSTAFNSVQVDGQRLAVTGTGRGEAYGDTGRGFALDDLPAAAITNIEIIKAPTPDMDHDGLGGTVNLRTHSALDYGGRRMDFKVGGNYTALRDETHPDVSGTISDIFELSNGRRLGVSLTMSYNETNEGFDNRDLDYFPLRPDVDINQGLALQPISAGGVDPQPGTNTVVATQGPGLAAEAASTPGRRPFNDNDEEPKQAIFYHEDTEYNNHIIERERFGFAAAFDLEMSDTFSVYFRPLYNKEEKQYDDYRYHKIMDNDHGDSCGATFDEALVNAAIAAGTEDSLPSEQKCFLSRRILSDGSPGPLVKLGNSLTRRSTVDYVNENQGRATLDFDGNPRGEVRYDGQTNDFDIELMSFSFGGEKLFEKAVLNVDANLSFADKLNDESDGDWRRDGFAFQYDRTERFAARDDQYPVINGLDPNEVFTDDSHPTRVDQIQESFFQTGLYEVEEDRFQLSADYEHEIGQLEDFNFLSGTWKVGAKYSRMQRDFDYTEVQYDFPDPGDPGYQLVPWEKLVKANSWGVVDGQPMPYTMDTRATRAYAENNNQNQGGPVVRNNSGFDDSLEQDYEAEESVWAGYAMATFQSGPFEVVGGIRAEYTQFDTVRQLETDNGGFGTTKDDNSYDSILPGLHFKYELGRDLVLRMAITETFSRPQLVDIIDIRTVNENDDPVEIEEGNPDLPPLESNNWDVALEWYRPLGFYSVGWFHKDMTGFSFEATSIIQNDPRFGGREVRISTPMATGKAINQGLELVAYQKLAFLPRPFNGLFLNMNYTYTDSDAEYPNRENDDLPTRGASKYLFYTQIGYEYGRLTFDISYRFRSPYVEGLAFVDQQGENTFLEDDVFGEQEIWDASLGYNVTEQITAFASVSNLFDEIHASRQGYLDSPEDIYFNERRIAVGVKGSF